MKALWKNPLTLWVVYGLAGTVISMQKYAQSPHTPGAYTAYENYVIFRNAFWHLLQGQNLYASFPAEQWDLFKYSPAFAVCMGPFSVMPDWLGLIVWNLLNALLLLAAIRRLPFLNADQQALMAWFVLPELVISLQNSQSNGLMAALMLWALIALEKQQPLRAACWIMSAAFIKIFGVFAAIPGLFYPGKLRLAGGLAGWALVFTLLPLLLVAPDYLFQVYRWWWELLQTDRAASVGISVEGMLQTWLGWQAPKSVLTLGGLLVLGASVLATGAPWKRPAASERALVWASILIWVVIFNHKAESPTYVIAMCGVALWYWSGRQGLSEKIMLWAAFVLVSLSPTDLFPRSVRTQFFQPYVIKAVPCIAIWVWISLRLIRSAFIRPQEPVSSV